MSDDKYFWRIGSPPPLLDKHSETKHRIVEEYVRRYIQTVMAPAHIPALQLTLVDGFSGGGNYITENGGLADGSPLLMMRAVREARAMLNLNRRVPRQINVDYSFIDKLPDTTDYLRYWLNGKLDEGSLDLDDHQRAEITTGDYLNELPALIQKIKARKMGEHALFVLDQYSYDDIPLSSIANVLNSLAGSEVILTFNLGSLVTFLADRAENRKPFVRLGLDSYIPWEKIKLLKATEKQRWRQIIQRHIAHGIRTETGAKYMTLFFVKPWGTNSWDYWLIHLSNRYRAHEVMKTLHWEHATEFGHELEPGVFVLGYDANKDADYTGQAPFDFGETSRQACIDGVREYFGETIYEIDKPVNVSEIFQGCVSQSTAAESHLMTSMQQLHASKNIIVTSKDGRVRRPSKHYRGDDVITPSKQIILI